MDANSVLPLGLLLITGAFGVYLVSRPSKPTAASRSPSYDELNDRKRYTPDVRDLDEVQEALTGRGLLIDVVGESHSNEDGTSRQDVLAKCRPGNKVKLKRERDNLSDRSAILVVSRHGVLGYVKREVALPLAALMDSGTKIDAEISLVTGGTPDKPSRGV